MIKLPGRPDDRGE